MQESITQFGFECSSKYRLGMQHIIHQALWGGAFFARQDMILLPGMVYRRQWKSGLAQCKAEEECN